jgi:hypothetical protein
MKVSLFYALRATVLRVEATRYMLRRCAPIKKISS